MKPLMYLILIFAISIFSVVKAAEVVCFLDTSAPTKLELTDVEHALDHCTHFVYGFATLSPKFFTLTFDGTVERSVKLPDVVALKKKYPQVKFLLSLGGDRDMSNPEKYLQLLEATPEKQGEFIKSSLRVMSFYEFDGLDLAYQLPRIEPPVSHSGSVQFWRTIFGKKSKKPQEDLKHKELFTKFVKNVSAVFKQEKKLLTLSVLPNVNTTVYFDIPAIIEDFNFINLWAFDFNTPKRNPNEADYPAPLMSPPISGSRLPSNNVNYQVQHWLSQTHQGFKIILAVPGHARAWSLSSKSASDGVPIIQHTKGLSESGEETETPGLLSWAEVCELVKEHRLSIHGSAEYGEYVIYPRHNNVTHSTWIAFDGPNIAHHKGMYARALHLGGMALVDLSMDDYSGKCSGSKYPMLKYMNGLFS